MSVKPYTIEASMNNGALTLNIKPNYPATIAVSAYTRTADIDINELGEYCRDQLRIWVSEKDTPDFLNALKLAVNPQKPEAKP